MSNQAIEKTSSDKPMEFIPFGAADKIKLTVALVQATVCVPTRSGKTCSARDAVRFMMLCQAQRLNPYAGDCFLCGYDGKNGPVFSLITAHQAFLKRAETCKDFEGMESGVILVNDDGLVSEREGDFILDSETCVGGWARVYRTGRKVTYRRASIAATKPPYDTPFWDNKFKAAGQIVKCAEADALRSTFPTLLGGLYTGEQLNMSSTVSAVGMIDLPPEPPPGIPETAQVVTDTAEPAPREKLTPQQELEGVIIGGGFDFTALQQFLIKTEIVQNADSLSSFGDISTDDAKRLLRATASMLKELAKAKGTK